MLHRHTQMCVRTTHINSINSVSILPQVKSGYAIIYAIQGPLGVYKYSTSPLGVYKYSISKGPDIYETSSFMKHLNKAEFTAPHPN